MIRLDCNKDTREKGFLFQQFRYEERKIHYNLLLNNQYVNYAIMQI